MSTHALAYEQYIYVKLVFSTSGFYTKKVHSISGLNNL